MFFQAYEFGRKVPNVIIYQDDSCDAARKLKHSGSNHIVAESLSALRAKLNEINRSRLTQGLALLSLAVPLSACGSSSKDKSDTPSQPEVSGRAIDGYLIGSTVSLSSDPSVSVLTKSVAGEQGSFSGLFGSGSIIVTGGKDVSTGKSFTGELRAPEGAKVITPITTLVEAVVSASEKAGGVAITASDAASQVAKGLGLKSSSDLLNTDYVATGSSGQAKAAAQVASVIAVVTAGGGEEAAAAVVAKIASKVSSAGEAGGKSKVLIDTAELKAAMAEVKTENLGVFSGVNDAVDLDAFVAEMAEVVQTVNLQIFEATSLKEIVATQNAVQDSIVATFEQAALDDFDLSALDTIVADIETIVEAATTELETYLETAAVDFIINEEVLDTTDLDTTLVELDAAIIDAINNETIDLGIITGILDGTLEQDDVVIPVVSPGAGEGAGAGAGAGAGTGAGTGAGAGAGTGVAAGAGAAAAAGVVVTTFNLSSTDDIQTKIDGAKDGDIIVLAAGRYDQSFTINKDIDIRGANYGISVHADNDDTVAEVYFDTADNSRSGGTNESWINGTVTVANDDVTLDGLRLHAYNGPLEFSGSNIDNFVLKNSYVTGFEGSNNFRYIDDDGTYSNGWNISDNLIGGVAGGVGGSLYLTGMNAATIDDNVFWRPGAAHMYLEDLTNVTVSNNFFLHGLHADGANKDDLLDDLSAKSEWGYVGFTGGKGYGNDGNGYVAGFGFGYDGSVATTKMGYGYGVNATFGREGYGYGPLGYKPTESEGAYGISGYGGGAGTDFTFYGRNYVAEVKGTTDDVTFTGNTAKFNSGGIQFWDENDSANSFTDTVISNNTFTDFINADPDGFLVAVESRHKTGLMSAVTFSVVDGSSSTDLDIKGNTFTGTVGEIRNNNDIDSLILVQGEIDDVNISSNTLSWTGDAANSAPRLTSGSRTDGSGTTKAYKVYTQGIHLAGDVNGAGSEKIAIQNNTFNTVDLAGYVSDAILIDNSDQSGLNLGTLSSTVYVVDNDYSSMALYGASSDFGGYKTANDEYYTLTDSGSLVAYSQTDIIA
jgi:hypothetical protein